MSNVSFTLILTQRSIRCRSTFPLTRFYFDSIAYFTDAAFKLQNIYINYWVCASQDQITNQIISIDFFAIDIRSRNSSIGSFAWPRWLRRKRKMNINIQTVHHFDWRSPSWWARANAKHMAVQCPHRTCAHILNLFNIFMLRKSFICCCAFASQSSHSPPKPCASWNPHKTRYRGRIKMNF